MSDLAALNTTALRNLMAQRGLRQWWLAEQLGVDRRNQLCEACWWLDKLTLAANHKQAPLDIAQRCDDRALRAAAQAECQRIQALSPRVTGQGADPALP